MTFSRADKVKKKLSGVFRDPRGMPGRQATLEFAGNLVQPAQFRLKLIDHQTDHPYSFMVRMADFFFDCVQRRFFTRQFALQKLAPPLDLPADDAMARL